MSFMLADVLCSWKWRCNWKSIFKSHSGFPSAKVTCSETLKSIKFKYLNYIHKVKNSKRLTSWHEILFSQDSGVQNSVRSVPSDPDG